MKLVDKLFDKRCTCKNVCKKGRSIIVEVDNKKYVIKNKVNNVKSIYEYLNSRNFNNYPKLLLNNDKYNVYEYIEDVSSPLEQKAYDMISLISILHKNTTYYKEMDIDEYKEIFEKITNNINSTTEYYNNLINNIERHMFMSPSEYLIARNISKIMSALNYSKDSITKWYDIVKKDNKRRIVTLYNNMDLNHILRNTDLYLISWEKATEGSPILDIYNFYKKNYNIVDFNLLLKQYEEKYPLQESEKLLFNSLISIPNRINFTYNEFINTKRVKKIIDYIYKTEVLISKNEK